MTTDFFSDYKNGNAEEFKRFLPVNVTTSYKTLLPAIVTAEMKVAEIIGQKCFDKIAEYYKSGSDDKGINEVVELLQFAIIRMAYYDSFDMLSVVMSDSGMYDGNGENRVYRYQSDALRESLHRQCYEFIDRIVEKLEGMLNVFPEFISSPCYTLSSESIIANSREFRKAAKIDCDYRLLVALRPYISNCENIELPFRIGKALADRLYNDKNHGCFAKILPAVRAFVCYKAIADSIEIVGLQLSHNGWLRKTEITYDGKYNKKPDGTEIQRLKASYANTAENLISMIVSYFKANKDAFPEINEIGGDDASEHGADFMDLTNRKIMKL